MTDPPSPHPHYVLPPQPTSNRFIELRHSPVPPQAFKSEPPCPQTQPPPCYPPTIRRNHPHPQKPNPSALSDPPANHAAFLIRIDWMQMHGIHTHETLMVSLLLFNGPCDEVKTGDATPLRLGAPSGESGVRWVG